MKLIPTYIESCQPTVVLMQKSVRIELSRLS